MHYNNQDLPSYLRADNEIAKLVRPALFAQKGWYPPSKSKLNSLIKDKLKDTQSNSEIIDAIIVPHAGYRFAASTMSAAWSRVSSRDKINRVIILGFSHRFPLKGISVGKFTHYSTPLGSIRGDKRAVDYLFTQEPELYTFNKQAHLNEHSTELQFPFIKTLFPEAKVVSLLVGKMDKTQLQKAADSISKLLNKNTIIVASSDFTHRGPRYKYTPFQNIDQKDLDKQLGKLDKGAFKFISILDSDNLMQYKRKTGITICGIRPINLLLKILQKPDSGYKANIEHYTHSGKIIGDNSNTVSYLGISFARQSKDLYWGLDALEQETLHLIARRTLDDITKSDFSPENFNLVKYSEGLYLSPQIKQKKAPFVTLKIKGELRGCIGHLQPVEALWKAVSNNTMAAALKDRRFTQVTGEEAKKIKIKISVLSLPRKVNSPKKIKIGKHGIILHQSGRRATYLPQVAPEQNWDRETTLKHLARKAGISPSQYKQAQYQVYTAQVF
ncbi:MAG: AmmeMemoRadiSam system protein B [Deltaproteobacteria bacterium]|jgi:AmmeMemoRadiSam system protein B/AmmeMemoRadiSam system protein A|nr:AmmeMemoRadiSam system protein B [Deltaproteobacteria bacterium]